MAASRTATKRLMKELSRWNRDGRPDEAENIGIERLGPVSLGGDAGSRRDGVREELEEEGERTEEESLLRWEAVINGRGVGGGYDGGRWLLTISIPPTYPLAPPTITFATPIVHPNISLETGEICLDLLKKDGWSGTYTILECVKAVRLLLSLPETDSPLNVDVAALIRGGDAVGARGLVEFWAGGERFAGV